MAETVLFAEQTVTGFAYSNTFACFANGVNPAPFVPEQGRSYIVNWDGEQFTRTAFSFVAADGASCIGIGNTIMTGTDSGEPFLIVYDATNGYFYFFSTETDPSHTISVLLQEKSETVLLEKRTIDNFVYVDGIYRPNPTYIEIETDTLFADGERYKITWDDVVYYCTSEEGKVGNQHLSYGEIGPGEPFTMLSFSGCVFFYTTLPGTSHTVEISRVEQPIVLKDRNNNDVPYDGTSVLKLPTADGGTRMFIEGEAEATTISLDFSQGDMEVIPDAKKLFNKVSIPTPVGLVPENIPKGRTIAGVKGELSVGGEVNIKDKPIRFYDPYGNVIYGYSRAEIQELTALPAGPALSGLTFERWTHTLEELKAVTYFADVGPMYKYGSNPATVLIVRTQNANTNIALCFELSSAKGTIYWGDGSSSTLSASVSKTYASAGVYNIAIVLTSGMAYLGKTASNYQHNVMNNSVTSMATSDAYLTGTTNCNLLSVLIGSYIYLSMYPLSINFLLLNDRLKFVSMYQKASGRGYTKQFSNCPGLHTIACNQGLIVSANYMFWCCVSLKKLFVSGVIGEKTFEGCDSLEEVIYGSGKINAPMMNKQWAMLMTTETPPTIGATNPQWGKKPIYVPDSAVEAYKTASGWSDAAAYILPASQYPDK